MSVSSNVMRDTFKLPKLPGNGFQAEMMKSSFKKKQMMQPSMGPRPVGVDRVPVDFEAIKIAAEADGQADAEITTVTLDRKVLRFTAFFKEGVHESRLESERVRRCVVYYYLEDDTISVSEPREDNAGMSQGCMLKRHQIPKPDGTGFYTYEDLNVGVALVFYGKCFKLCDCDPFTRTFMNGLGIDVPDAESFPTDDYHKIRARPEHRQRDAEDRELVAVMECFYSGKRSRLSPEELKAAKKFLINDRKVLKFQATWDDSSALYGDLRRFILYYFLADDSVEVTEDLPVNAGRDPFPSFVRRRKCAKPNGRYSNPSASLSFKSEQQEFYTDQDLFVGAEVDVFGRKFKLVACDGFTARYLSEFHSRTPTETVTFIEPEEKPKPKPVQPPPYNGYGDEDDSLGSWKNLVLKPPKKNVKQYIENNGAMLKYRMKMESSNPANEVRRFVLTYYLADDTVSIFEPAQRNSGIIGGKFLQRMKVKHSNKDKVLESADLFIGAKVEINHQKFVLYATDEKSLSHMEQNGHAFTHSNINTIMMKLRAMLMSSRLNLAGIIREAGSDDSGGADYVALNDVFLRLGLPVSEHEILTVLRYLDADRDGSVTYNEMLARLRPDGAEKIDEPWEKILEGMSSDVATEHGAATSEQSHHASHTCTTAAHAATYLLDRYSVRRALFHNAFRNEADHSPDGKLGVEEFQAVANGRLKLGFDAVQLQCLTDRLFTPSGRRFDYNEMLRILQGTSLHPTTLPKVAAYVQK